MKLGTRVSIATAGLMAATAAVAFVLSDYQAGQQADPNFLPAVAAAAFTSQHPELCFD
jgi:hypothetical protein